MLVRLQHLPQARQPFRPGAPDPDVLDQPLEPLARVERGRGRGSGDDASGDAAEQRLDALGAVRAGRGYAVDDRRLVEDRGAVVATPRANHGYGTRRVWVGDTRKLVSV